MAAYWLLPAEPCREFFHHLIKKLALRFDAPEFQPHITLFLTPENARPPQEVLANIPLPKVTLVTHGLGWSAKFTKTLFVKFEKNRELMDLVESIRRLSGVDTPAEIDPHLSLLYQSLPHETQQTLAETTSVPFDRVRFDSISAMRCISPTETKEDVRRWRLIATQSSTIRKTE